MFKIGLALELQPGCLGEYKKRHDELWPEMAEMMAEKEISMSIYRHGDTLFLHGTAPTPEHWESTRDTEVTRRWNENMKEVLKSGDDGNLVFHDLEPAFYFGICK